MPLDSVGRHSGVIYEAVVAIVVLVPLGLLVLLEIGPSGGGGGIIICLLDGTHVDEAL